MPENLFKRIVTSFIISSIFLFFLIKGGVYFVFFFTFSLYSEYFRMDQIK